MVHENLPLPSFEDAEFSAYSQTGEDGILLLLFAILGMGGRRAVEISAGDGIECNTANLIVNHGWTALLIDADETLLDRGRQFYAANHNTKIWPPKLVSSWVTADNVNSLISQNGFAGDLDLFSLDLDGIDYWIWKALESSPRVVVVEYQTAWGPEAAKTIMYDPGFRLVTDSSGPVYAAGASLMAMTKLGAQKGYSLVGVQRYGFNAFFVRNDLLNDNLRVVTPQQCFAHPHASGCVADGAASLQKYRWIDV